MVGLELSCYTVSIPFLISVSKIRNCNLSSHWSYPFILLDISANITMWLFVFVSETDWHVVPDMDTEDTYMEHFDSACELHRTAIDKFIDGDMQHLFYPRIMEMAIVSVHVEILSNVWFAALPNDGIS